MKGQNDFAVEPIAPKKKMSIISFQAEQETIDAISLIASENDRTMSYVLRKIVTGYIQGLD